eukprot:352735-Chlamydomonas_euryale.AAC.3
MSNVDFISVSKAQTQNSAYNARSNGAYVAPKTAILHAEVPHLACAYGHPSNTPMCTLSTGA